VSHPRAPANESQILRHSGRHRDVWVVEPGQNDFRESRRIEADASAKHGVEPGYRQITLGQGPEDRPGADCGTRNLPS
jgi:hypothetical protein